MTTAFYSRPITTNYCHYKFKIKVSHSEKLPLGGLKNTSYLHTTRTSTIITHNSTQLPTKIVPITQLPRITQNYQYHSRISILLGILLVIPRTILLVQGIMQIALQLLIISTIRTFTQSLLLRDTIPGILTLSEDVRL